MSAPDPELLAAFLPEFRAGAARLAGLSDLAAAARQFANLRAMADAVDLPVLRAPIEAAAAALEAADADALAAAVRAMLAAVDAGAAPAPSPGAPRRIRTLVVDDSPTMRRVLRGIIEADPDFEVVGEAGDGAAALDHCAALAPDLVLLDIEMPGMDGIGMLSHWSLEGRGAVLVVSSAAPPGSELARSARRLGAAGLVGKPSGALSADLAERRGAALLAAARRAAGVPAEGTA